MTSTVILRDHTVKQHFAAIAAHPGIFRLPIGEREPGSMSLPFRIRLAREARGLSQAELARRLGKERPTVTMWESGKNQPRLPMISAIAQALNVGEDWLMTGHGRGLSAPDEPNLLKIEENKEQVPTLKGSTQSANVRIDEAQPMRFSPSSDLPVYAGAEGGAGELIIHSEPVDYVSRPSTLAHVKDAFAVVVTGTSMVPAYKPGELAMVNPRQAPAPGDDCILMASDDTTGERRGMIKEFVRSTPEMWVVKQHNPDTTVELPRSEWQIAYKVVGKLNR